MKCKTRLGEIGFAWYVLTPYLWMLNWYCETNK